MGIKEIEKKIAKGAAIVAFTMPLTIGSLGAQKVHASSIFDPLVDTLNKVGNVLSNTNRVLSQTENTVYTTQNIKRRAENLKNGATGAITMLDKEKILNELNDLGYLAERSESKMRNMSEDISVFQNELRQEIAKISKTRLTQKDREILNLMSNLNSIKNTMLDCASKMKQIQYEINNNIKNVDYYNNLPKYNNMVFTMKNLINVFNQAVNKLPDVTGGLYQYAMRKNNVDANFLNDKLYKDFAKVSSDLETMSKKIQNLTGEKMPVVVTISNTDGKVDMKNTNVKVDREKSEEMDIDFYFTR